MNDTKLIELARAARKNAYAPFSGYTVGCAIEAVNGKVFVGCNIESVSFGATLCAERVALGTMIADGCRKMRRIILSTEDGASPCGICRQLLLEFVAPDSQVEVVMVADDNSTTTYRIVDLLPHGFASTEVNRTKSSSQ